jgi:hypothetical protein
MRQRVQAAAAAAALVALALPWPATAAGAGCEAAGRRYETPAASAGAAEAPLADQVASMLEGSFSSSAQAAADSAYFDIRLVMARIWPDRGDGPWLYVEQAVAGATDRPYRQRVYRVTDDGSRARSDVYTLRRPERFVGAWRDPGIFASLTPDSLALRDGCAVFLRPADAGGFIGGTEGNACRSDLRGAAYATSEIVLTPERLLSWDRGFDGSGAQVWGAEKGGYVFERLPAAEADAEPVEERP